LWKEGKIYVHKAIDCAECLVELFACIADSVVRHLQLDKAARQTRLKPQVQLLRAPFGCGETWRVLRAQVTEIRSTDTVVVFHTVQHP
jgi:hypothetical protein